ncbi:MAG: malto-oligosyltrehalose synthase, partial [Stellaceae bacterium]
DQYGIVLEKGEIVPRFAPDEGSFSAWYYEHRFPLAPRRYPAILDRADPPSEAAAELQALSRQFAALGDARSRRQRRRAHEEGTRLKAELAALAARAPVLAAALDRAAASLMGRADHSASWHDLDALFEAQHWRAAYWRTAADEINYRRFFNINDLAGIRVEREDVFERAHRRILALIAAGQVQGLRVDHIDGLYDPRVYCARLQREASAAARVPEGSFYIVVEKILAAHETLRDWPIAGSTGYEFIGQAGGLFIDPAGKAPLTEFYRRFTGAAQDFAQTLHDSQKRITSVNLASEVNVLARAFLALAMRGRRTRDFTLNLMRAALEEVVARFPVYRTYVSPAGTAPEDRRDIDWAVGLAKKRWPGTDTSVFDFIHDVLAADSARRRGGLPRAAVFRLAQKFQQLSGPVTAKGVEDTAFYRYNRLIGLNEVGDDPGRFGLAPAAFHRLAEARLKRFPHAMLAATTHDTKRGEDARARLHLLSELPDVWAERVERWERINALKRTDHPGERLPDANDEYFFYQTMVAAWPVELSPDDADAVSQLCERVRQTMTKMVREAKERSGWSNPDLEYEAALGRFISGALDASRPNPFLADLCAFVESLARPAAINSLAMTVIRLVAPGVPDVYQGAELFDFSMVDPDNRGPVDFARRRQMLGALAARMRDGILDRQGFAELAAHRHDGREKLFLIWRALALRHAHPDLFATGAYQPLEARGRHGDRLCFFARLADGEAAAAVTPRLVASFFRNGGSMDWQDTEVLLPEGMAWQDALSGRALDIGATARTGDLLADFPVALLYGRRTSAAGA